MANPRLRVYFGPESQDAEVDERQEAETLRTVNVPFGDVVAVLAEALCGQRQWVYDFAEDPVTISEDLYEVLLTYQRMRRPPA